MEEKLTAYRAELAAKFAQQVAAAGVAGAAAKDRWVSWLAGLWIELGRAWQGG